MKQPREEILYTCKMLETEEKTYVLMGLEKDKTYSAEELFNLCKIRTRVYPEGFWDYYFKLNGRSRKEVDDEIKSNEDLLIGANWCKIRSFIHEVHKKSLWDNIEEIIDDNDEETIHGFADEEERKEAKKAMYDRLDKAEGAFKGSKKTLSAIYKICALNFISPDVVVNGTGKIFFMTDSVMENYDIPRIASDYNEYICEKVGKEMNVLNDFHKVCIQLTKKDIMEATGIKEDEILEYEVVIPYELYRFSDRKWKKIMEMMKRELYTNR